MCGMWTYELWSYARMNMQNTTAAVNLTDIRPPKARRRFAEKLLVHPLCDVWDVDL